MLQEELASQLGVSQGQLSKVERGKVAPTLEILLCVATRFGKSLDWIVKGATGSTDPLETGDLERKMKLLVRPGHT